MTTFRVVQCHYMPGAESVTIVVRAVDGMFSGVSKDLYTTQAELDARRADPTAPWGDAEVFAEAEAQVEASGGVLEANE